MNDRTIADIIWHLMKGIPLPANYTDEEVTRVIYRYWHKAMERGRGGT
jgi:hypothetical protein